MKYYFSLIKTEDYDKWERGKILLKFLPPKENNNIDFFTKMNRIGYDVQKFLIPYETCKPEDKKDNKFLTLSEFCDKIIKHEDITNIDTPLSFKGRVGVIIGYVTDYY